MQAVTGKDLKPVAASLSDYQRFKFRDKTFPGIIKSKSCSIEGMLYKDIDKQTLELLDQFEDVAYERCLVDVQIDSKTEKAFVYMTRNEYRGLLGDEEWDLGEFKRKYLSFYLRDISKL